MSIPVRQIGPYQINYEIDHGGMATIYHAVDTRDGDTVALKILMPHHAHDAVTLRRFQQEADEAQRLRHPNIVRIYEAGEIDGYHFIAMEYAEKGSLAKQLRTRTSLMSVEETLAVLLPLANALDYAHKRNVLHRDVKPSNVLVGADGRLLLADFGISRRSDSDHLQLTGAGEWIGTPRYMSPEQIRSDKEIDQRSDIYSLGVLTYQLLTGHLPFDGEGGFRLMNSILNDPPPPPERYNPQLPSAVCQVLLRVLSKDPNQRYASASEFIAAIQSGFARKTTRRERVTPPEPVAPMHSNPPDYLESTMREKATDSWWIPLAAIGVGLIVLGLIGWSAYGVLRSTVAPAGGEAATATPVVPSAHQQAATNPVTDTLPPPVNGADTLPTATIDAPATSLAPTPTGLPPVPGEQIRFDPTQYPCATTGQEIFFRGTVYVNAVPTNGYYIHYRSLDGLRREDRPVISGDSRSLDPNNQETWEPGDYKQLIQSAVENEESVTWLVWLADAAGNRVSVEERWSSQGAGCAIINFSER